MRWIRTIVHEIFGLFVDDGSFAAMILAWVALLVVFFTRIGWLLQWRGLVLFCGLAAILVGSCLRYARRKRH